MNKQKNPPKLHHLKNPSKIFVKHGPVHFLIVYIKYLTGRMGKTLYWMLGVEQR